MTPKELADRVRAGEKWLVDKSAEKASPGLGGLLTAEQQLRLLNLIDSGELQVCLICNDRFAPVADAIEVETFFELAAMLNASISDAEKGAAEFMREIEATRDY